MMVWLIFRLGLWSVFGDSMFLFKEYYLCLQKICHYVLMPVVYLMGVRWEDAGEVAELIALKTFLNEFVAYEKLSKFIQARMNCDHSFHIMSVSERHISYWKNIHNKEYMHIWVQSYAVWMIQVLDITFFIFTWS